MRRKNLECGALLESGYIAGDQIDSPHAAGTDASDKGVGADLFGFWLPVRCWLGRIELVGSPEHGYYLLSQGRVRTVGCEKLIAFGGRRVFGQMKKLLQRFPICCVHLRIVVKMQLAGEASDKASYERI